MAGQAPLVIVAGQIQRLPIGDLAVINPHVMISDTIITAGYSTSISRYVEIAAGVTLEIGVDADLEIG